MKAMRMEKRILVIGSLNIDVVINLKHLPQPGETITGLEKKEHPGGKGANQAYAAAKLGGNTVMIGMVGADGYGQALRSSLKSAGVDTSGIIVQQGTETGLAFIYVDENGENTIVLASGANAVLSSEDIRGMERLTDASDIVLMQLEIPIETVAYAIEAAGRKGKTIVLDPAPVRDGIEAIYDKVDILTPNEGELAALTGMSTDTIEGAGSAAKSLIQKGVGAVIVTLGGKGALLVQKDKTKRFPAKSVKAVDTTAAGDVFSAAVCAALSEGKDIEEAIVFANAASAITVTREGAQPSIPSRQEVEEMLWQK
jgi:ribokinase